MHTTVVSSCMLCLCSGIEKKLSVTVFVRADPLREQVNCFTHIACTSENPLLVQ